jgi:hypothetical protein
MAMQNIRQKGAAVIAVAGLGALIAGCSPSNTQSAFARPAAVASYGETAAAASPVSVSCETNQRAVLRQVFVNGAPQAQLECVASGNVVGTSGQFAPVAYQPAPAAVPIGYTQPVYDNTRVVRSAYPAERVVTRPAVAQRVAYQPERERVVVARPKRSVKKSAIIIGSSAGVGAGIGAAVGGKKGAGIGALIGGGGAALWDQLTRRK